MHKWSLKSSALDGLTRLPSFFVEVDEGFRGSFHHSHRRFHLHSFVEASIHCFLQTPTIYKPNFRPIWARKLLFWFPLDTVGVVWFDEFVPCIQPVAGRHYCLPELTPPLPPSVRRCEGGSKQLTPEMYIQVTLV